MPYREIHDDEDGVWVVFSTQPRSGANVRPRYADGWLSFQRGTERRRLAPIPPGWDEAAEDQVRMWLRGSELVARTMDEEEEIPEPAPEPRGAAPMARESAAAEPPPPAAEPAPARTPAAAAAATGPAARVQKSIERIRAMLSDIRSHDG
ncbi:MAG TPA: hypothetical protein VK358_13930 [Longimicrobium sp.]|nr:hypothetical protein [Longimicrobium sp.]